MVVYDVSLPIQPGMAVWPGDPEVALAKTSDLEAGDGSTISRLVLGTHTGTHVDAPAHLLQGGAGVEALPLPALIGPAIVAACSARTAVTVADLEALHLPPTCARLLLKTRNSVEGLLHGTAIPTDYCALAPEAGAWLAARDLALVGVDAPSVDAADLGAGPVHAALLRAGIVVVEGLDLQAVPPGRYTLCCLPLRLVGADGAPARAILLDGESAAL
ncbi:MAG: cyclase family protein [Anaerolineae bacterium]